MKKVVILGNGFDLDLGLKTGYSDFINSEIFNNEIKNNNYLALSIKLERTIQKWIDLESFFKKYIIRYSDVTSHEVIYKEYLKIRELLTYYIDNIEYKINPNSVAASFIKAIHSNGDYTIYSFNYTDLKNICESIDFHINKNMYYNIHGLAKDKNIILGTEDDRNIGNKFSFIFKFFDHNYTSSNINKILEDSDSVIFFGHSLGETDYHYFSNFFNTQSNRDLYKTSKDITIFTFDEKSEREILNQLRNMGGNNSVGILRDMNNFQIFCTSIKKDKEKIDLFFNDLLVNNSRNEKENQRKKLEGFML